MKQRHFLKRVPHTCRYISRTLHEPLTCNNENGISLYTRTRWCSPGPVTVIRDSRRYCWNNPRTSRRTRSKHRREIKGMRSPSSRISASYNFNNLNTFLGQDSQSLLSPTYRNISRWVIRSECATMNQRGTRWHNAKRNEDEWRLGFHVRLFARSYSAIDESRTVPFKSLNTRTFISSARSFNVRRVHWVNISRVHVRSGVVRAHWLTCCTLASLNQDRSKQEVYPGAKARSNLNPDWRP